MRIVFVSSLAHPAGVANWGDKQSLQSYSPFCSYGLSKLASIMASKEMQRRCDNNPQYGADSAVAIHPGAMHVWM